jgi:hypothetical protein
MLYELQSQLLLPHFFCTLSLLRILAASSIMGKPLITTAKYSSSLPSPSPGKLPLLRNAYGSNPKPT